MHYVKHFDILGVDTAQIPCIELQGVPNTATEGAVGLLGINMLSEDHELYVCVAVKGNVYTWMPLKDGKDGVSIVKTELNENCELIITLSNGTQTNLGVIKGEKGEKGEQADLTKIKEKNEGKHIGFWSGDTETFENLEETEEDTWYLLEDDKTLDEIEKSFDEIDIKIGNLGLNVNTFDDRIKSLESLTPILENDITNIENGTTEVPSATNSKKVNNLEITQDENGVLKIGDIIIPQKRLIWSGSDNSGEIDLSDFNQYDKFEIRLTYGEVAYGTNSIVIGKVQQPNDLGSTLTKATYIGECEYESALRIVRTNFEIAKNKSSSLSTTKLSWGDETIFISKNGDWTGTYENFSKILEIYAIID